MVQILPPNETPSFLKSLIGSTAQALPEATEKFFARQAQMRQEEAANEAAKRLGIDTTGLDPDTRRALLVEQLKQGGAQNVEGMKQRGKENLYKQKQNFLSSLFPESPSIQPQDAEQTSGYDASKLTDENIARASAIDPALGRELRAAKDTLLTEKREKLKASDKKKEALRAETLPIKKEISDRAQAARESIQNKQNQMEIIKRGNLDDPTYAAAVEALPFNFGKRLLSPDTVEYKAGLVDEFKDLKQIFSGATRVKEMDILEGKIADIYLTDEQKQAILESRINALQADVIREETAIEMDAEGKDFNYLQYRKELDRRAKPKLESLFNRTLDTQKAIIKDAENMKKIPLNYDDPEGRTILEQIMKEAGGDRNKARQIAKKKGYTVGK